jgi:predicted AAA+ superfamily ATPase
MIVLRDAEIAAQNPWWQRSDWVSTDPHLQTLAAQPRRLPAPLVDEIDLQAPAIHLLRGPRQVGKSTALKLLVRRALEAEGYPVRRVLYLAFDLLEDEPPGEMAETVVRAKRMARGGGTSLILLDEVTVVPRWRAAVKYLWDRGELRNDVVICTGSSAIGLHDGAERLPGRRGAGADHGMWPLTFAAFAETVAPEIPPSKRLEIADLLTGAGRDTCLDMQVHLPTLDDLLDRYLRFGGLPAAVAEAVDGAHGPSASTRAIAYDSLLKELAARGASGATAHRLLERVVRSLGSKLSWTSLAQDLGTGHGLAREYVERLARGYFLLPLYFWRRGSHSGDLSKDKKLYFGDPLLHTVAHERAPGIPDDRAAMVENAIALSLLHRYEPVESLVEGFETVEQLHVWGTRSGGEMDFVCGPFRSVAAVEVKYRTRLDRRTVRGALRALPGRPVVVATKDVLEFHGDHAYIPSALLLWALG